MIEGMECRAAAGEGVDIGAWTPVTNSRASPASWALSGASAVGGDYTSI